MRDGNLRHVEFFFNPDYFYPNGIDYPAMVDGMIEGIEAAKKKFGVSSLLICCIDRSTNTPAQAVEIVETAIAHRRDHVVGIGLDGAERAGPPATFAEAYALAKRAGLHRTAHCCEDNQTLVEAPPTNYLICRDVLQCDRIDHGYNMLASDFVMAEARRDGLYFTPCAWTSLVHNRPHRPQRIRRMVEAGLNVTINTDDPAMFETDLGHGFTTLFELDRLGAGHGPQVQPELGRRLVARRKRQERAAHGVPPRDRRSRQGIRLRRPPRRRSNPPSCPWRYGHTMPANRGETVGCPCFSSVQACSACLPCP